MNDPEQEQQPEPERNRIIGLTNDIVATGQSSTEANLQMEIVHHEGGVRFNFNKPVMQLTLKPGQAFGMATHIMIKAHDAIAYIDQQTQDPQP